jgi:hypothetical protein
MSISYITRLCGYLIAFVLLLGSSNLSPSDKIEQVRAFTRNIEFDYVAWTINALSLKLDQSTLRSSEYLSQKSQHQLVIDYLKLMGQIQEAEAQLYQMYADPNIADPLVASKSLRIQLNRLYQQRALIGPVAEAILESQISIIIAKGDLSLGGQPIPPVLYHIAPMPSALIVSPRNIIRQDADITLVTDLTLDQQIALEENVDKTLNVSSLVVGIGGVGVYPTMVMETTDLNWLADVVAHEWTHNFLSLRPLGVNYMTTPELRTMNETAASIAGKELGRSLIDTFYPELLPPPPSETPPKSTESKQPPAPPEFDFRTEMHITRITVDQMLTSGKIAEAEAYMEARRKIFWENGYQIRKINQAYFAFYGAYADEPTGAAGKDPVGAAVRTLRAQTSSLASFLKQISWMWSYEQLQKTVGQTNSNSG